jgi:hypothetical protein
MTNIHGCGEEDIINTDTCGVDRKKILTTNIDNGRYMLYFKMPVLHVVLYQVPLHVLSIAADLVLI